MIKARRLPFVVLLAAALLSVAGCVLNAGRVGRVQAALEHHYPEARFERELVLNLGPDLLSTGAWLAGGFLPPEQRVYGRYLLDLDHVTVGIYKVHDLPDHFGAEPIAGVLPWGWHTLVKVRDEGTLVWIGRRGSGRALRDLYVVTLSEGELVLLRLEGDISEVLADALAKHDVLSMMNEGVQNAGAGSEIVGRIFDDL